MDFNDSPEEATFRQQVRDFVDESFEPRLAPAGWQQYPDPRDETEAELLREWRGALGKRGWIAPHWPQEFGGAGLTAMEQFIFNEEMAKTRAPEVGGIGMNMVGPTLIRHGSEQQKETHLPRITSNRTIWCQGYSEPGAGSDLASLQTRAVRDGDEYVVNGQKVWNTVGHKGRLDAPSRPHRPGGAEASGHHDVPARHAGARHHHAADRHREGDPGHHRVGHQRGLLRGRPHPGREPSRRGEPRLVPRNDAARPGA